MYEVIVTFIAKIIVLSIVLNFVPGVNMRGYGGLFLVVALMSMVHSMIPTMLVKFEMEPTIIVVGLTMFITTMFVLYFVNRVMGDSFEIRGWVGGSVAAFLIADFSYLTDWVLITYLFK